MDEATSTGRLKARECAVEARESNKYRGTKDKSNMAQRGERCVKGK